MDIISTNLKELLTRFASGEIEELPSTISTPDVEAVIQDVYKCRQELKKVNVLPSLAKIHPNYIHSTTDDSINNDDLIFVVENEHVKNSLLEFDLKLTDALTRNQDNPLFPWSDFAESLINILKPKNKNDFIYLDEVNFDRERVIASWGFPTLDTWLEGGITESSFNIFYAPTNIGKTTAVTVTQSANLIRQGKTPLIIALEGSPQKLALKILANLAGFADVDPLDFSNLQKETIINMAKCMPHIPIISRDCNKRWQLDRYIQKFKPDVIIYDQITISGKGLGWEAMAGMSNLLKTIAQSTSIPVIAITQSSEQNYNSASSGKEEDLKTEHKIKYSEALIQDATNVIEITKHTHTTSKRSFTVRKTKDDMYSKHLPLRLVCELTSAGYVERYAIGADGKNIPLVKDRPKSDTRETEMVKVEVLPEVKPIKESTPVLVENTELLTEVGTLPSMPDSVGLFSQDVWENIPNRLQAVVKYLPNPGETFKRITDAFALSQETGSMPQYTQEGVDCFLIQHTDFVHEEFRPYFYRGLLND